MARTGRKLLAMLMAIVIVLCALPFTSVAATTAEVIISSDVTNGVADENVSFDYMVTINDEPYNGTVKGSDSKNYEITDGKLTMPYNVSVAISVNDGDTYNVKRLAYAGGKYKPVEESEAKYGTIATVSYYVSVNGGDKTEISQSEYNSATNNGANTAITTYVDANGVKYAEDEIEHIKGYCVKRTESFGSTSYSFEEYEGDYVKSSLEEHTITIDDVSCHHSKNTSFTPKVSYDNSLTGYFDGVADEPKTKSESSIVVNLNSCNSNLNANSYRVYFDHAIGYEENGLTAVFENNNIVNCTGDTGIGKGQSAEGTYASPAVENKLSVFTAVEKTSYEYTAEEKENPSVSCIFDVQLIIPTARLDVNVSDCKGKSIEGITYTVTNEIGDEIELTANSANVPFGEYTLNVTLPADDYAVSVKTDKITATTEGETYTLEAKYHKLNAELKDYLAPTCEIEGYSGDKTCSICGNDVEKGNVTAPTGHSYTHYTYNNDAPDTHTAECDNGCEKTDTKDCTYNYSIITPATNDDEGLGRYTCSVCGNSYDEIIPANKCEHNNTVIINDAPAQCGIAGYTGDTYCNDCKQIILTGDSIPALEHSYTNYVHADESEPSKHIAECDNGCGTTDEVACTFDSKVTKEPTKKLDGVKTYTCSVCKYSYDEPIPALGYGSITIGAIAMADGIDIDSNVVLSYYVQLNGEPYNGEAIGNDGNTYQIVNGIISLPYNVTAIIDELDNDTTYIVKMLTYDNDKYALINESESQFGEISTKEYYVTINGHRQKVTAAQFKNATNNGENLTVSTYVDENFNQYDDVSSISGYYVKRSEILGSTSYSLEEYNSLYATDSLSQFDVEIDGSCQHTRTDTVKFGVTLSQTHVVNTTVNGTINGEPIGDKTSSADKITSAKDARNKCNEIMTKDVLRAYHDATEPYMVNGGYAIVKDNTTLADCEIGFDEQGTKSMDRDAVSNTVYTFIPVTQAEATYDIVNVKSEKNLLFDVRFAPAPTGTFVVDFVIYQGTVPEAYDQAEFEIKNENGTVLTNGTDYTLSVESKSVDLKVAEIGYTVYKFEGLKYGNYVIYQTKTADGFILDVAEYPFTVSRADGSVSGNNFATSDFDSKYTALTNNTYNLVKNFRIFKNNCYSIDFTTLDQKDDPVKDAKFFAVERDAFLSLLWTLVKSGVSSIGSMDINEVIKQLQDMDWQNIDASTIINVILSIVKLNPDALGDITLPAILTTSSDENGLVSLSNTANMLNLIGAVTENGITGAQLAELLQKYFGNLITDDMAPLLDALAAMTGNIHVHTGMPAGSYILAETEVPEGYNRNVLVYTMTVSKTGTALASAGIIIPVLVDTINTEFGIDLREILINEEEFNKINETVGTAFDTFTEYSNAVIDEVVNFLRRVIGEENAPAAVLNRIKQQINDYNDQYDDLAQAIGQTIKDINSTITDDMTEDWVFLTPRIFVDVKINITDCQGNALNDVEYIVYDKDGNPIEIKNNTVNVPFGTYASEITSENEGYYLIEDSKVTSVNVNDENGEYSFEYKFHVGNASNAVEPTCTEGGYSGDVYCTGCNVLLEDGNDLEPLGHDFDEWTTVTEPDCTNKGSEKRVCLRCNIEEERNVNENGHSYTTVVTAPTCTEQGYTTFTCDVCGDTYIGEYVDPLGHTIVIHNAVSPTCTEEGLTEGQVCSVCNEVLVEQTAVPALDHDWSEWETIDSPSCTATGSEQRACTRCELIETRNIDESGHSWEADFTIDKAATCTEDGSKSIHCANCDAVKDSEVIPATGHTEVTDSAVPVTCTENGLTEGKHCSVCGDVTVAQTVIVSNGHTIATDYVVEPTCTKTGLTEGSHCSVCNEVFVAQDIVDAKGHTSVTDVAVEPTCTKTGLTEGSHCSVCNEVLIEQTVVAPNGHTEVVDKGYAPTCTDTGLTDGKHCSVCGKVLLKQVEIKENGHKVVVDAAVEPTCTKTGLTEGSHCSVCNEVLVAQDIVDAKGHTVVTDSAVEPTCTKTGLTEGSHCSVCNETLVAQTVVPANGHTVVTDSAVEPTCTKTGLTEGSHCSVCDEVLVAQDIVDAKGHTVVTDSAVEPTCTKTGLTEGSHCSVCDETLVAQTVVPANGHTVVTDSAVEPTCTKTGLTEGKHCSVCNEILSAQTVVSALDHDMGEWTVITSPNCTDKGSEKRVCSRCDYTETRDINENGHSWEADFTIDKAATCTEDGSKSIHCANCDAVKDSEVVPATGHSWDEGVITSAPTTEEFGEKTFTCTVCNDTYTAPVDKLPPEIIKGMNKVYEQGSGDSASFTSNAAFSDFLEVLVDGNVIDADCYSVRSGSTIVTLTADYLATLDVGVHTLGIKSTTGLAETEFEITAPDEPEEDTTEPTAPEETTPQAPDKTETKPNTSDKSPATGSEITMVVVGVSLVGALMFVFFVLVIRRRHDNANA